MAAEARRTHGAAKLRRCGATVTTAATAAATIATVTTATVTTTPPSSADMTYGS